MTHRERTMWWLKPWLSQWPQRTDTNFKLSCIWDSKKDPDFWELLITLSLFFLVWFCNSTLCWSPQSQRLLKIGLIHHISPQRFLFCFSIQQPPIYSNWSDYTINFLQRLFCLMITLLVKEYSLFLPSFSTYYIFTRFFHFFLYFILLFCGGSGL